MVRVALICRLIIQTLEGIKPKRYLISVDEKTGIQALERFEQRAPLSKGHHQRAEFEYIRHGTTTLMAAYSVASGSIIHHQLNPTRTEEDFCRFIEQTCQPLLADPEAEVILLADQLNTHLSQSLVKWVAQQIGFSGSLGKKAIEAYSKTSSPEWPFWKRSHIVFVLCILPNTAPGSTRLKLTLLNCNDT